MWPTADVIVGNPPFVGDKKMRAELGGEYTERLRTLYKGRVPGGADLVCYWFEKARAMVAAGTLQRAGFVSTNSVRGGKNREVLDRICASSRIFAAWADEEWVNNGAAVRVSLTAFGHSDAPSQLNGTPVAGIGPELSPLADGESLSSAKELTENESAAFQGPTKGGEFDVPGDIARQWLQDPCVQGRNADVLRPWLNGLAVVRRSPDMWIIDFGDLDEDAASTHDGPFGWVLERVKPERDKNAEPATRRNYWRFKRSGADAKQAVKGLARFIATPEVSKHRVFVWLHERHSPDKNLVIVARQDDATMGILSSRAHEVWSLQQGTSLEDRPRYTSSTTFRTFPFPPGLTPADTAHQRTEPLPDGALIPADLPSGPRENAAAIARAAKRLNDLRTRWLNPPEWCDRIPEVTPLGMERSPYPDRLVPKPAHEKELAKRTLTNLYNAPPAWLTKAHADLDTTVATAYGWTDSATPGDDEILRRLLALNRVRATTAPKP